MDAILKQVVGVFKKEKVDGKAGTLCRFSVAKSHCMVVEAQSGGGQAHTPHQLFYCCLAGKDGHLGTGEYHAQPVIASDRQKHFVHQSAYWRGQFELA